MLEKNSSQTPESCDILIIGAGTAGLSAAIYGARAGCQVTVLENNVHGGQIINTTMVKNYPAIPEISGFDFAQSLYKQAKNLGAKLLYQNIHSLQLQGTTKKVITNKNVFQAKAVIIATGTAHKSLDCPGEAKFKNRGISYCATCDGAFYKNQTTLVVGGENTALSDALFLANLAQKVYLVHRRDEFRGHQELVDKVLESPNIEILYDSVISEFKGEEKLTQALVRNLKTDSTTELDINGAFIAIGQISQNELFADIIEVNSKGYIMAGEDCQTNIPGVWCAGDCREKPLRQLVTAAADGAVAASAAASYIRKL